MRKFRLWVEGIEIRSKLKGQAARKELRALAKEIDRENKRRMTVRDQWIASLLNTGQLKHSKLKGDNMSSAKLSDEWKTPQWLFDQLDEEFNFDVDLCATAENTKCARYCKDIFCTDLRMSAGHAGFMNPPYSNPAPYIKRALDLIRGNSHATVVMLLKVDTSTKWWGLLWDYQKHRPKPWIEIRFYQKELNLPHLKDLRGRSAALLFLVVLL